MDPSSAAFLPRDELWRITSEMSRLQQIQSEHSERLSRVERRQDEDITRTKSLWGSQSPFPGILAGTPQQRPIEQPPADAFSGFDDPTNLIGSLQLDAEDEPRRVGATSRANSVRFDETANQGHWAHPSRASLELLPRSGSSLSSHPLIERTYSHKSDGRQSSAGQSVHSAASRANSLGIDTLNSLGASEGHPINPGLFILGTCPAIVRCWLNTNFKHDSLLYAAICSGSHISTLSADLVTSLGFEEQVSQNSDGVNVISLKMYLPEATMRSPTSRLGNAASQIPSITVDFQVDNYQHDNSRSIGIVLGSDVLRTHSADVLFSTNVLIVYDDEHAKLSVPLVRPENEVVYSNLQTRAAFESQPLTNDKHGLMELEGLQQDDSKTTESSKALSQMTSPVTTPLLSSTAETHVSNDSGDALASPAGRSSPSTKNGSAPSSSWTSWRRDPEKPPVSSELGWGKTSNAYQRREQGIKVLRPLKSSARSVSNAPPLSNSGSQSRFFEDGKRRISGNALELDTSKKSASGLTSSNTTVKDAAAGRTTSNANPVGGASAFSWLSK